MITNISYFSNHWRMTFILLNLPKFSTAKNLMLYGRSSKLSKVSETLLNTLKLHYTLYHTNIASFSPPDNHAIQYYGTHS